MPVVEVSAVRGEDEQIEVDERDGLEARPEGGDGRCALARDAVSGQRG